MLQLHVWGPAFGLSSIDPQCLAAIAYLSKAVPQTQWQLIASSDPTLSPTRELPALRDDSLWIAGFQNIVAHLSQMSSGEWNLDRDCTPQDQADISAYTSFLETHAQPLVDLTLYVSSENYHAFTRPAYAHILHWPNTWLLPPQRRAAAKARTDHLNFSSLDLDTVDQEESETKKSQFATGSEIPKRLIRSTARTTGSLAKKKGQQAARFRLERLAEGCFTPLNRLLDGKTYLLSDGKGKGMTSLDCLALGYLALVLVPDVPQSWLKQMMKRKYPDLCGFVKEGARECWGLDLTDKERGGNDALTTTPTTTNLPYHPPTTSFNTTTLLLPLLSSLPLFGPFYRPPPLLYTSSSSHLSNQNNRIPILPTIFLALVTTTLASGAYFLSTGELPPLDWVRGVRQRHGVVLRWPFGGRVQGRRLGDMGEAGRVLGVGMRGI